MFCTNCGTRLDDDALFCPNCGTRLKTIEEKPEEKPEEVKAEEKPAEKPEEAKTEEKPAEKPEEVKAEEKPAPVPPEMPAAPAAPAAPEVPSDGKADKKAKKAGLHPKPSGGKKFLSVLLCIMIFAATVMAGLVLALRMSCSGANIRKTLENLDVASITMPDPESKEAVSLMDFLESASGFNFEKTAGIKKADLEKFLEKPYVLELFTDTVVGYVNYFMDGKTPDAFTKKDALKFIEKHNDDLYSLTGFSFVYQDPSTGKSLVYDVDVSNAFKDLGTDEVTPEFLEKKLGISFAPFKFAFSLIGVIVFAAVAVFFSLLVLLLHKKTKHSGYSFVGMTIILSGIVIAGLAGAGELILGKWNSTFLNALLSPLAKNTLIIGGCIFALGFLIFVIGRGICTIKAKKRLKQVEA